MHEERDTSAAAGEAQRAAFRLLSPSERAALALQMSEEARALAFSGIRQRRPEASTAEIEVDLRRIMLGEELAAYIDPAR